MLSIIGIICVIPIYFLSSNNPNPWPSLSTHSVWQTFMTRYEYSTTSFSLNHCESKSGYLTLWQTKLGPALEKSYFPRLPKKPLHIQITHIQEKGGEGERQRQREIWNACKCKSFSFLSVTKIQQTSAISPSMFNPIFCPSPCLSALWLFVDSLS